jgi:hypothetical protein
MLSMLNFDVIKRKRINSNLFFMQIFKILKRRTNDILFLFELI